MGEFEVFMKSIEIPFPALAEGGGDTVSLRKVLGGNLFGASDWTRWYDIPPETFAAVPPFLWRLDLLHAPCPFFPKWKVRQTHFAFLGISAVRGEPLTLFRFEKFHPSGRKPCFDSGPMPWYGQETFTWKTLELRWYLLLKRAVPGSTELSYAEQMAMLPSGYEPPEALAEAMKDIFFYRSHFFWRYLNAECLARCADMTSSGAVVEVGNFDKTGLSISHSMPDTKSPDVAIGASVKLPQS